MLDFRYQVFLSVARHLSFSKAAKELSLTQPAVSFQIRHLEEQFKARLFVRYPNRIELTPVGELLHKELAHIHQESQRVMEKVMQKLGQSWGTLVIGASTTIGNFFLPPVVAKFKRGHANVAVKLLVDNTDQVLTYLADGLLDFAIVEGPVKSKHWIIEEAFIDELVVIAPKDYKQEHRGTISKKQVGAEPFVSREAGSGTRAVIDGLKVAGKPLIPARNIILEMGSSTAIKKTVEGGLGLSLISRMTLEHELALGTLKALRVEGYAIYRSISFVFPRGMEPTQPVKEILDLCREEGKKIGAHSQAPGRKQP